MRIRHYDSRTICRKKKAQKSPSMLGFVMKKIDRNPTFRERRAVNWDESLLLPFRNNPQCCTYSYRDADRGRRDGEEVRGDRHEEAERRQPAAGGVITNPIQSASLQKLPCRFKAYKRRILGWILPSFPLCLPPSAQLPTPPFSLSHFPSAVLIGGSQVAPRCGGPGYRNLGG